MQLSYVMHQQHVNLEPKYRFSYCMTQSGHNYSYATSPLFKGLPYLDSDCARILNVKIDDCAKAKLLLVGNNRG